MRIFAAICVLALCVGCSRQIGNYGNVAEVNSAELVQDTVFVMFETYPPAHTRLALVQEPDDAFGSRLVEALRLHGYAVAEYVKPAKGDKGAKAVERPDGLAFSYLIDHTGVENEIRINVHVGAETLSRLYFIQGEGEEVQYVPQGFWSRREGGGKDGKTT